MKPTYQTFELLQERGRSRAARRIRHKWWMGILTIFFFTFCGTGLAVAIEAGMTFTYPDSPAILNTVFIYMGFPGRLAEYLYQGGSTVPSMTQRFFSDHLCVAVNSVAYTVLFLAWFLRPGANRLDGSTSRRANTWDHLAD
jgi:hypothetical protein